MAKMTFFASEPIKGQLAFLRDVVEEMAPIPLRSILVIGIPEEASDGLCTDDVHSVSMTYKGDLYAKERAVSALQREITVEVMRANILPILDELDEEEEDEDE